MYKYNDDKKFLDKYCESMKFIFDHIPGLMGGVMSPEFKPLLKSRTSIELGINDEELAKILIKPQIIGYLNKVITSKQTVKILTFKALPNSNIRIFIVNFIPVINPSTDNIVAIWVRPNPIEVFNVSTLLFRYFKYGAIDIPGSKFNSIHLTKKEKCVIFFFMLNFESQAIADLISKIENKNITKNAIDQIFSKRLLPKFSVFSRKALYEKLHEYGFQRLIPHNALVDDLFFEVTDYLIFDDAKGNWNL